MARNAALFAAGMAITLFTFVLGTPISPSDKKSPVPGTIAMPISRKSRSLSKRDGILVDLGDQEYYYSIHVGVGSPPQSIYLGLDTGSSDTWVFTPSACSSVSCVGGYSFDPSQSPNTFKDIAPGAFNISYHDGSNVLGDYITDNLELNGVTINSLEMGLATSASGIINKGLMGVGFDTFEASASIYPNIIDDMVSQGLINGHIYSLWLDALASGAGTILFGGYDSTKYSGELAVLPIIPSIDGVYQSFVVDWTSLSITDKTGTTTYTTTDFAEPTILDSGTTVTRIDPKAFDILYQYFGASASTDGSETTYYVDCGIASWEGSVDYGFPGITISVPFSELALPVTGESYCLFGFYPDTQNLFGDTFLRSAYVVYDLDNKEIGLAQTIFE